MIKLISIILLFFSSSAVLADTTYERDEIGPFTIEVEKYQNTGTPMMHVANRWTYVKLIWKSADDKASFEIKDEGRFVSMRSLIEMPDVSCIINLGYTAIGAKPSNDLFWESSIPVFQTSVNECGKSDPTLKQQYIQEFIDAKADFPRASDRWKDKSKAQFGNIWRRCIKTEVVYTTIPDIRCEKFSKFTKAMLDNVAYECQIDRNNLRILHSGIIDFKVEDYTEVSSRKAAFDCIQTQLGSGGHLSVRYDID